MSCHLYATSSPTTMRTGLAGAADALVGEGGGIFGGAGGAGLARRAVIVLTLGLARRSRQGTLLGGLPCRTLILQRPAPGRFGRQIPSVDRGDNSGLLDGSVMEGLWEWDPEAKDCRGGGGGGGRGIADLLLDDHERHHGPIF